MNPLNLYHHLVFIHVEFSFVIVLLPARQSGTCLSCAGIIEKTANAASLSI